MEARGLEGGGAESSVQISGALLPGLQSTQGEGCPHHPTPRPGPQALAAAVTILNVWGLHQPGASLSCPLLCSLAVVPAARPGHLERVRKETLCVKVLLSGFLVLQTKPVLIRLTPGLALFSAQRV